MSTQSHGVRQSADDDNAPGSWGARFASVRRDVVAALPFGLALIPTCLSSGLLAFSPFGHEYLAKGITLGFYAIVFGGICTALLATTAFIVYSPRTNLALIQATAATYFLSKPSFANNPEAAITAMAGCVLLGGLFVVLFSLLGIARIIKYTPHPVMAGFINGAALAIAWSQIKPFIDFHGGQSGLFPFIVNPTTLAFILLLAAFIFGVNSLSKKLPAPFVGLGVGVLIFYALDALAPDIQLGRTIGTLSVTMPPESPIFDLWSSATRAALISVLPDMIFIALAIAVVATFESLLVFRMAQNLADRPFGSARNVAALGIGNCASASVGGIAFSAASGQTQSVYREGGRTRLVPITIGLLIFALITAGSGVVGAIPVAAISALLLQNTLHKIDMWSVRLLFQTLRSPPSAERRRAWLDLAVVGVVMAVTVTISVLPGVLAGILVAGVVFIANMSRPIVRRRYTCDVMMSKRMRNAEDAAFLRDTGRRRVILELHGVLFFGNADDLSEMTSRAFAAADMIVFDCRGISDVDVSGATILRNLFNKSRRQRKQLFLCNVPQTHAQTLTNLAEGGGEPSIFPDLDSTLEWMEERVLQKQTKGRANSETLPLEQHDFVKGLDDADRAVLAGHLVAREFPAGTTLCVEGEPADRMWLLTKGSVSVRLSAARGTRRIASCAIGTTVGEMAFIEGGTRSASVVTDEDTVCYELGRAAYDAILRDHPVIANKLLTNLSLELARRLRRTSDELRETVS
jgi:MFS superfamily sulfate permease-like transporter/CRP-like cAMP-binding protein